MIEGSLKHYSILRKLGKGAMAEVYLARDNRLGREVALKHLPSEVARDPGRLARFEQEAKTLAALNHPNIVTIYSVEEHDGDRFLTMELVEGETLDSRIPDGGLPADEFFELAIPLTHALAAAHERDIVHRDLKPSNVMIDREGRVKILDFGLSRLAGEIPDTETLDTAEDGLLIGTLPYMSPEQVRAVPADRRSDIYTLGVLLYEMATGTRPFRADSGAGLICSILRDRVTPLEQARPDLPRDLSRLVGRCLEKKPANRWQSSIDLARSLEAIAGAPDSAPREQSSIAVLPFADMSPDQDQDYFCEGISEELINALNRVENLRVASRSSSFQFSGRASNIEEIGRRLAVNTVLEGSVRRAGDRLRITAELVDVANGFDLWSKRFDRPATDIFAIQEEIAERIVDALRVTLSPTEKSAIRHSPTREIRAYDHYLMGRKYFYEYGRRGIEHALEKFAGAVALDPSFALAYAGIADCRSYLYANAQRNAVHLAMALAASRKALELDPKSPTVHTARGVALSLGQRAEDADRAFARALELNPKDFDACYFFARHCFSFGRPEQAIELYRRAIELRPEDFQASLLMAQIYDDLDLPREALGARRKGITAAERYLEANPDNARALYMAANGLVALGEIERGCDLAAKARSVDRDDPMTLYNLACIYSLAGDAAAAVACLEEALTLGFSNLDWLEHDSNLDMIREEPRFKTLRERYLPPPVTD